MRLVFNTGEVGNLWIAMESQRNHLKEIVRRWKSTKKKEMMLVSRDMSLGTFAIGFPVVGVYIYITVVEEAYRSS